MCPEPLKEYEPQDHRNGFQQRHTTWWFAVKHCLASHSFGSVWLKLFTLTMVNIPFVNSWLENYFLTTKTTQDQDCTIRVCGCLETKRSKSHKLKDVACQPSQVSTNVTQHRTWRPYTTRRINTADEKEKHTLAYKSSYVFHYIWIQNRSNRQEMPGITRGA